MDLFKYYVNEWYRNRINLSKIFYCQIHVTKRCQNNCIHCYFKELKECDIDISISELNRLLDVIKKQALSLGLSARIDFTGGDPLLYPYLGEAIKHCDDLGIQYGFKCNPETLLNPSDFIINSLLRSSGVSLSLDGLNKTHDYFRREGSFDCTINAIKIIKELGIHLRLNTTVSRYNISDLIPLLDFLIKERIVVDDYTWARYWSMENPNDIISSCDLKTIFCEMTQYMRNLFSLPSFYFRTPDNRVVPQIMFGFKEHQWYPFLVQEGSLILTFKRKCPMLIIALIVQQQNIFILLIRICQFISAENFQKQKLLCLNLGCYLLVIIAKGPNWSVKNVNFIMGVAVAQQ